MMPSGSALATDIRYAFAHWDGLTRFLNDGRLELDTNPVENAIRLAALTRKNALFAGHEVGAENWALLAYLAPGVLKRLVYKREVPTVTLLKLTDITALPWHEQPERVFD